MYLSEGSARTTGQYTVAPIYFLERLGHLDLYNTIVLKHGADVMSPVLACINLLLGGCVGRAGRFTPSAHEETSSKASHHSQTRNSCQPALARALIRCDPEQGLLLLLEKQHVRNGRTGGVTGHTHARTLTMSHIIT